MATKAQIDKALKLIEQQREAAAAAAAAEQQAQNELQMKLGEVLVAAAQKPRSKWAEYCDKPLTDLLAELGLIDAETAADKADSDAAAEDKSAADSAESGGDDGVRVEGGVLAQECGQILSDFFKARRAKG